MFIEVPPWGVSCSVTIFHLQMLIRRVDSGRRLKSSDQLKEHTSTKCTRFYSMNRWRKWGYFWWIFLHSEYSKEWVKSHFWLAAKRCEFLFLIRAAERPPEVCAKRHLWRHALGLLREMMRDEVGIRVFPTGQSFIVAFVASCCWILEIHFFLAMKTFAQKTVVVKVRVCRGTKKTKTTQLYGGLLQLIIRINRSNVLTWEHWLMFFPYSRHGFARWKLTLCRGPGTSGYWGLPVQLVQVCFIRLKVYQMYINHDRN